jgi:hypothetical protein
MNRENQVDILLQSILNSPDDDYNEGLVREAVRAYLNRFSDDELSAEMNERKQDGRV